MEDSLQTITDTIATVTTEVTKVAEQASDFTIIGSFWVYWFPAILLVSIAIFFRRFMFFNTSVKYSSSFAERDVDKDTRFRNIDVVLMTLVALIPYVNWFIISVLFMAIYVTVDEDEFPFYLNKEKFYSDKLMNFLFNGEMEKPKEKTETKEEKTLKDL